MDRIAYASVKSAAEYNNFILIMGAGTLSLLFFGQKGMMWFQGFNATEWSRERKLAYRWLGLHRVSKTLPEESTYLLEEMDRNPIDGTYLGSRLKKFIKRKGEYIPVGEEESSIYVIEDELEDPLEISLNPEKE